MFKNVLLTVSLNHKEGQEAALEAAKKYAAEGSYLYVVSVIPQIEGGGFARSFLPDNYDAAFMEKAKEALHDFTDKHLPTIDNMKHLVIHGKVYEKVIDIAEKLDIDLIITMAALKKEKKNGGFGPNVARIVRNSGCSVLVLR